MSFLTPGMTWAINQIENPEAKAEILKAIERLERSAKRVELTDIGREARYQKAIVALHAQERENAALRTIVMHGFPMVLVEPPAGPGKRRIDDAPDDEPDDEDDDFDEEIEDER